MAINGTENTIIINDGKRYILGKQDADFFSIPSSIHIPEHKNDSKSNKEEQFLIPLPSVTSIRDFYTFEEHVRRARERRGLEMVNEWYEIPVYYYSGTSMLYPSESSVPYPDFTKQLDYEMEVAAVIGREGINISENEAMSHVFGFTLMNDWSARDLQRKEMAVGLGPSKSKDFATSIGQYITTTDEIEGLIDNEGRLNIGVECYVNGRRYSSGNLIDMFWTFRKLIAWASKGTMLRKGDLIMSGTISTGCILELGAENYNWLKKGDTVSMRSSTLGELNNKVV